eukprot:CAMPEP_0185725822 /NCGR_PEP_ID=MMETSP1171-20130828/1983_1 /TAXON_ID=374046 /ORGANISM="Helicotheca tamensis, Strain CCMP826" /LENGTH=206 /DNA_ID=CAMNT_0028394041 /DNA_START=97 /DNA_END=717 /DNA_ORIENTATION=-
MRLGLIFSTILACTNAYSEFEVNVTNGVTECTESNQVEIGDYVSVHYTLTIDESSIVGEPGKFIGSSYKADKTVDMQIGVGTWIKGWDMGITGLCIGAKASIIVPPDLGYGEHDMPNVPAGATLNFAVEVVDIIEPEDFKQPDMFTSIDLNKDGKLSREEFSAFFKTLQQPEPTGLFDHDDADGDGFVTYEEFSGPKGDSPPGEEL